MGSGTLKRVVIIASGETERRALPHLVAHVRAENIVLEEVLIPPGHKALTVEMAARLVTASWHTHLAQRPDKFVILVDADGKVPEEVIRPFNELRSRLGPNITSSILCTCAQWHLEAWYFGDARGLRTYLGGSLGQVDTSAPDQIQNPKLHLRHLLQERAYTAVISEEIARTVDARQITHHSPSFRGFVEAMRNGHRPEVSSVSTTPGSW